MTAERDALAKLVAALETTRAGGALRRVSALAAARAVLAAPAQPAEPQDYQTIAHLADLSRTTTGYQSDELIREAVHCWHALAALRAENERLRADAERYRYLREQMTHEHCGPNIGWTLGVLLSGDDPDAAIDAAMKAGDKDA